MRRRIFTLAVICGFYAVNRYLLIPAAAGTVHLLLSGYGADFLAGAWILCFLNLVLVWSGRRPLSACGILPVWAFLLACGIFWEYIAPLYLARSVSDPLDILAYWLGGTVYYLMEKKSGMLQ